MVGLPASEVILIKHASPTVEPRIAPSKWTLSEVGRQSCARLSVALRAFGPAAFFTSPQPKASETAAIVAAHFGATATACDGLREHDETGAPFFESETAFAKAVGEFFARPGERVLGAESARETLVRFAAEVDGLRQETRGPIAVVSHGRAISLFVAARAGLDGFELWRRLTLPSFVVLDAERGVVEHIAAPV